MNAYLLKTAVGIFNIIVLYLILICSIIFQYYENVPLPFFFQLSKCHHYCWDSKKSLQMPLMTSETIGSSPVNSLVKKACDSFGLEAISFRSSRGAQATPTEKMVIPAMEILQGVKTKLQSTCKIMCIYFFIH